MVLLYIKLVRKAFVKYTSKEKVSPCYNTNGDLNMSFVKTVCYTPQKRNVMIKDAI